jgi:GntR family transcriptional regulator, transcriptional repressor for pyruvate dehydrogenase complex
VQSSGLGRQRLGTKGAQMVSPLTKQDLPLFGPVHPTSLKEQVASELKRLIDEGMLKRGEQLPSERELAEKLHVSRGTVREGIRFLHALGYLDVRHGLGTFVHAASGDAERLQAAWRDWTLRHANRIHDLLELRKGIESFAAELASVRQLSEPLARMGEAVSQMCEAAQEADVAALVEADVAFHDALCEGSANAALAELVKALGWQLLPERAALFAIPGRPEQSVREHRAILEAVRVGDVQLARLRVLTHLESVQSEIDREIMIYGPGSVQGATSNDAASDSEY